MSLKSIIFSILSVLVFGGLLFLSLFILFGINTYLGIAGIIATVVVTSVFTRIAIKSSNGIIDKLLAKVIVPILILLIVGAILLTFFLK